MPTGDRIGALELLVLLLQGLQPGSLVGGEPGAGAAVDLGLGHPRPQGLDPDAELARHTADDSVSLAAVLLDGLEDHPHRSLLQLRRVPLL